MNKEQLIIKAKELGIKDAETLTVRQLNEAIATAEAHKTLVLEAEAHKTLVLEAEELGITGTADYTIDELQKLILATENSNLAERNDTLNSKVVALAGALGIDGHDTLNAEELTAAAAEKIAALTPDASAKAPSAAKKAEGKTDQTFKSQTGKNYQFKSNAPAAFRFLGKLQTQKEWIKDTEAMELMALGNLSYVESIKK